VEPINAVRTSQKKSEKAGKLPTIEKRFFVSQTAINAARFLQFGAAIKMQMLTANSPDPDRVWVLFPFRFRFPLPLPFAQDISRR